VLAAPERRLAAGLSFSEKGPQPAIFVEREGSWAHDKADTIAEQLRGDIDVVVGGSAHSMYPRHAVRRSGAASLRPGASVGHCTGWAGSVGCLVTFVATRRHRKIEMRGFLGAAHVLGKLNRAEDGDAIIHPGYPDGQRLMDHKVGSLHTYSYLGHYDEDVEAVTAPNLSDVALVALDDDTESDAANLVPDPEDNKRQRMIRGVVDTGREILAYGGQEVFMVGRTSTFSRGTLSGFAVGECSIKLPDNRIYLYQGLLRVDRIGSKPFSRDGDSGALVYTSDFKGLGLLVGGSDKYSWIFPLTSCLSTVSAELLT
jgi:hypothetical protein